MTAKTAAVDSSHVGIGNCHPLFNTTHLHALLVSLPVALAVGGLAALSVLSDSACWHCGDGGADNAPNREYF